jgi:molybdopterin converting factor small subunit
VKVLIPSALVSYTNKRSEVEATGPSVGAILLDLERQFPGIRFRIVDEQEAIRPHLHIFVSGQSIRRLETPVGPDDEVAILMALSGG